jgi:hypothetical protein
MKREGIKTRTKTEKAERHAQDNEKYADEKKRDLEKHI